METERMVGQLFMVGFHGTEVPEEITRLIGDVGLGGVIFFKRNLRTPDQIAALTRRIREEARRRNVPLLFQAVDQEGGVVARLGPPFKVFPSQGELPESTAYGDAFERGTRLAEDLKQAGFNFNLAPMLDLKRPDDDSRNALRSFSHDPVRVAELGAGVIRGLQANGIAACAKHFPGLGEARVDPHETTPRIEAPLGPGLIPFRAALAHHVASVMVSHAVYVEADPENPAGFSREIVEGILRGRMGYRGVVLSDDLEMGAVADRYSLEESSVRAFEAGCDVLLVCSRVEEVESCVRALARQVARSRVLNRRFEASLQRILRLKESLV